MSHYRRVFNPAARVFKRFWLLVLAYVVPTFLLGFVWHLVLFDAYYRELGIYRADPIIPFGFSSMLLQAVIFAWAFPRIVTTPSLANAMKYSGAAALLSWSFTTVAVAAKHPMTSISNYVIIETAFTAVQFLLVGPAWALVTRQSRPA